MLGTAGVFQPVDYLHHATLPNQGDDMGGTISDRRLIIGAFSASIAGTVPRVFANGLLPRHSRSIRA
jgi:hypothetical protein